MRPHPVRSTRSNLAVGLADLVEAVLGAGLVVALAVALAAAAVPAAAGVPPERLSATGLFVAGPAGPAGPVADGIAPFVPQYPLWTDGAAKRRWLSLPPGGAIDGRDPDAWQFPPGTRLWKEFAYAGRPVETRLIERLADGSWRFAAYVWDADGRDATLAPDAGVVLAAPGAPGGRHAVPSRTDCLACHGSAAVPVLGVGTLQLSPARDGQDPVAPGGRVRGAGEMDLRALVQRGWLRDLPPALLDQPPQLAARTPLERAALGTLMGNCAHCHNASENRVPLRLDLAPSVAEPQAALARTLRSLVGAASRWQVAPGQHAAVVVPGAAQASVLVQRMASREPRVQMPPLGTAAPDHDALALLARWIDGELPHLEAAARTAAATDRPPRRQPLQARQSHPEESPR
ncbi:MAG: hypothetical protein KF683_13675 [Rubrivivax sp.]|nr:hypothetical protein [Rubrivivax sp.]